VSLQASDWQPTSDPITAFGATTSWTNAMSPGPIYLFRVVQLPTSPARKPAAEIRTSVSSGHAMVDEFLIERLAELSAMISRPRGRVRK
jgi:hypothetical protein